MAFDGYLRAGELLSLRVGNIFLPDDLRLVTHDSKCAGLLIRSVNTGVLQFIGLSDSSFTAALASFLPHGSHPCLHKPLFPFTYPKLSAAFREAIMHLRLPGGEFTLHSLRHGGATRNLLRGSSIRDIMVKGRWSSLNSFRLYLNAVQGLLLRVKLCDAARSRVEACAEITRNLQCREGWTADAVRRGSQSTPRSPRRRNTAAA